jgi:vacuolar-type H+-ATPase subunit E/Vma4
MSLKHLLEAITAETDRKVQEIRNTLKNDLEKMRQESSQQLSKKKHDIVDAHEKELQTKKRTLEAKKLSLTKSAVLSKKKEIQDRFYEKLLTRMSALPESDIEEIMKQCLTDLPKEGTIHPASPHVSLITRLVSTTSLTIGESIASKGGFLFTAERQEKDCTFEHLVSDVIRPKTELLVSQKLFT